MANYRVNQKTKTIILDMDKITDNEMRLVQTYVAAGYLLKEKKEGITFKDMQRKLQYDPELSKELDKKIKAKENYMLIRKWYLEQIDKKS